MVTRAKTRESQEVKEGSLIMLCKICGKEVFGHPTNDICWTCQKRTKKVPLTRVILDDLENHDPDRIKLESDMINWINQYPQSSDFSLKQMRRKLRPELNPYQFGAIAVTVMKQLCEMGYIVITKHGNHLKYKKV